MVHETPNEGRMVADRFRRIWHIAQRIADEPGYTRFDLARLFNLSERQVQADLNIIRADMRLPLVRRQGYRFEDGAGTGVTAGALNIDDVLRLVTIMAAARQSAIDVGPDLATKLSNLAPLHLRPLAHELFLDQHRDRLRQIAEAALSPDERAVRVLVTSGQTVTVRPELIVPYRGVWWMVGALEGVGRARMWRLDQVLTVEPVAIRLERKNRGAA